MSEKLQLTDDLSFGNVYHEIVDGLAQVGSPTVDMETLATSLCLLSLFINPGPSEKSVRRLYANWAELTNVGAEPATKFYDIDGMVAYFQRDLEEMASLNINGSYTFYTPGSAGLIRLMISLDQDRMSRVGLLDCYGDQDIQSRFEQIFPKA